MYTLQIDANEPSKLEHDWFGYLLSGIIESKFNYEIPLIQLCSIQFHIIGRFGSLILGLKLRIESNLSIPDSSIHSNWVRFDSDLVLEFCPALKPSNNWGYNPSNAFSSFEYSHKPHTRNACDYLILMYSGHRSILIGFTLGVHMTTWSVNSLMDFLSSIEFDKKIEGLKWDFCFVLMFSN